MERKIRLFRLSRKRINSDLVVDGQVEKTYIDQISNFSAACVRSGVMRAVDIFMNDSGEHKELKHKLIQSILSLYKESHGAELSKYYDGDLLYDCLCALKTAIYSFPHKNQDA